VDRPLTPTLSTARSIGHAFGARWQAQTGVNALMASAEKERKDLHTP